MGGFFSLGPDGEPQLTYHFLNQQSRAGTGYMKLFNNKRKKKHSSNTTSFRRLLTDTAGVGSVKLCKKVIFFNIFMHPPPALPVSNRQKANVMTNNSL